MKKAIFIFLLGAMFSLVNMSNASAQLVNKKPKEPMSAATKPAKPGPNYVWTGGEWKWNKKKDNYDWEEGKWEKQKDGHNWVHGDWKRDGTKFRWTSGHWQKKTM